MTTTCDIIYNHVQENEFLRATALRQTVQRVRVEFAQALATCQLTPMAITAIPQLLESLQETLDDLERAIRARDGLRSELTWLRSKHFSD